MIQQKNIPGNWKGKIRQKMSYKMKKRFITHKVMRRLRGAIIVIQRKRINSKQEISCYGSYD